MKTIIIISNSIFLITAITIILLKNTQNRHWINQHNLNFLDILEITKILGIPWFTSSWWWAYSVNPPSQVLCTWHNWMAICNHNHLWKAYSILNLLKDTLDCFLLFLFFFLFVATLLSLLFVFCSLGTFGSSENCEGSSKEDTIIQLIFLGIKEEIIWVDKNNNYYYYYFSKTSTTFGSFHSKKWKVTVPFWDDSILGKPSELGNWSWCIDYN